MNSEVYINIPSASLHRNASNITGRNVVMQQNYDPKHTASKAKDYLRENQNNWPCYGNKGCV